MKKAACISLAAVALLLCYSIPSHASHFHGGVYIGPVWGPGWWGPTYSYPYPYYPYYPAPNVVVPEQPQEYVMQEPQPQSQQQYWYYCAEPQGYYPYVKQCPKGWSKVVPTPAPPETEE